MKKIAFLLLLISNTLFAEGEKIENKTITEKFTQYYNTDKFDDIFSMFSSEMKSALPLEKTKGFLTGLKSQAGNINDYAFVHYKNGSYASYKTNFDKAVLELNISIDSDSLINGLFIKPFVEQKPTKKASNSLKLTDSNINKKQSDVIFDNTQSFPNQTQLAFAFIKNGEVNFYGIKNDKGEISHIENSSSVFEIGSISKVFTSTLLARYVVDNKIELNDSINQYFDFPFKNDTQLNFINLSNHTSGLSRLPSNLDLSSADPSNPYKNYGTQDLDDYLKEHLAISSESYAYSNLGTGLLGYALSKYSNSTYEEMLQTHVFQKHQMTKSTSIRKNIESLLVKGLDADGKETSNWDLSVLQGAGGILSTVEDLAKFVSAQFYSTNTELNLSREKTFTVNKDMDMGLGWHILSSQSKNKWYWHNGGTGGYTSFMLFEPKDKNGIIILSNVSAFNPNMSKIDKLGFALMTTLEVE